VPSAINPPKLLPIPGIPVKPSDQVGRDDGIAAGGMSGSDCVEGSGHGVGPGASNSGYIVESAQLEPGRDCRPVMQWPTNLRLCKILLC